LTAGKQPEGWTLNFYFTREFAGGDAYGTTIC